MKFYTWILLFPSFNKLFNYAKYIFSDDLFAKISYQFGHFPLSFALTITLIADRSNSWNLSNFSVPPSFLASHNNYIASPNMIVWITHLHICDLPSLYTTSKSLRRSCSSYWVNCPPKFFKKVTIKETHDIITI